MWIKLALGLVLQAAAIYVIIKCIKKNYLSYIGFIFIAVAFAYHGLTEIVQILFPDLNRYRDVVDPRSAYEWVVIAGGALLVFALAYYVIYPKAYKLIKKRSLSNSRKPRLDELDWRVTLTLAILAYLFSISGSLWNDPAIEYWIKGLSGQFMLILIVFAASTFVIKCRGKYLLPVIFIQSIALALVNSRLMIILCVIILVSAVQQYGFKVRKIEILLTFALVAVLAVSLVIARDTVGREKMSGTMKERVASVTAGITSFLSSKYDRSVAFGDFVYRFDGNSFGALIHERLKQGKTPAGLQPLWNDLLLTVPSFITPQKTELDEILRDEKTYMNVHYELWLPYDFLPMTLGILYSYRGLLSLFVGAALLGLILAAVDAWRNWRRTSISLLIGIGFMACAVSMEQGIIVYFTTFRGVLALCLLLIVLSIFVRRKYVKGAQPGQGNGRVASARRLEG